MHLSAVLPRIFRAEASSLRELALAFVRAQEYSDGARFFRKIFALEDFIADWKARHRVDSFTYADRWNGYNVSGEIYAKWLAAAEAFGPLSEEEELLRKGLLRCVPREEWDRVYVFGVCDDEGPEEKALVTEHETAHAFYALDERYRRKALALVRSLPRPFTILAEATLREKGYHHRVFPDEIQAYLATGDADHGMLGIRTLHAPLKRLEEGERLKELYKETKRRWKAEN